MRMRKGIIAGDPLPCGDISRAVFIGMCSQKHATTFRGQWDFEEIWYLEHWLVVEIECTGCFT